MDSRDKFAQMLREGYETLDPEKEQREYIRELLRQKEQQRKRRIKTITAVAAVFLIVVGAVLAVGGCFGSVEADKNDRTKVEEQDGSVVISDENADGQEVGSESVIETDWNKVDKLKEKYPEMITFTDVPEGMEFVSVEVKEYSEGDETVLYKFKIENDDCCVYQRVLNKNNNTSEIEDHVENILKCGEYNVQINRNENRLSGVLITDMNRITVVGNITEENMTNIFKCFNEN